MPDYSDNQPRLKGRVRPEYRTYLTDIHVMEIKFIDLNNGNIEIIDHSQMSGIGH